MVSAKRVYGLTTPFVSVFPDPITKTSAPTTSDKNYPNGFVWIFKNGDTRTSYFYGGLDSSGDAVWILAGPGASEVDTLTGDTGGAISPTAGNINILGGDGLTVAGAGSTLTINRDAEGGFPITPYVVGSSGEAGYTTIQAAVNAANVAGGGMVYIQPGTYTEDLTLFDQVHLVNIIYEDASPVTIAGTHTPPNSGVVTVRGIRFTDATAIFNSAAAGSTNISCEECTFAVTNGHTFTLPNWTGTINCNDCGSAGTNDGFFTNTGGADIFTNNGQFGAGTTQTFTANGDTRFDLSFIDCPVAISSGTIFHNFALFSQTVTVSGDAAGVIVLGNFFPASGTAINLTSSGALELSNCNITTANNPAIDGTGSITLAGVSFANGAQLAATLTVSTASDYVSGSFQTLSAGAGLTISGSDIDADGSNANIDLTLTPKGTGNVVIDSGGLEAGTGIDLDFVCASGQGSVLTLGDSAGATDFIVEALDGTDIFTVNSAGTLTFSALTVAGAFAQTGGTFDVGQDNASNAINIGGGTTARAIGIGNSAAAHTITIGTVTGAASLDLLCGTGNFTLEGNVASTYDISATGANTGTVTIAAGTGARTVNLATGGTGVKTVNIGTGAIGNVITIGTVTAAASLDLLCGTGNFTLEGNVASTYDISATGANTGTVTIAAGTGARTVNLGTGGTGIKTINIGTGAIDNVITMGTVTGAASLDLLCGTGNFTLEGNVASTYDISSTGVNTGTVRIGSGTGARTVEIAGGGTGIKTVNIGAAATADVITIGTTTGAGSTTIAAGTGDITLSGTVKEVNSEFAFSSGTDLTVTQSPIMQSNANTGAAPTGATGDVNIMAMQDGCLMEQFILGAGQTIIAPRMTANGLDLALDQVATEGAEYNFGARSNAKHVYTIGTSDAFFCEATIYLTDMSGCLPMVIGFRKVEANNATIANYTDYACIGMFDTTSSTNVVILDELNSGGQTATDTTDAWGGDTTAQTVKVLVSAAGVVTFEVGGSAASVAPSFTFDNTDEVMFFCHILNGADLIGEAGLQNLKIGFQA